MNVSSITSSLGAPPADLAARAETLTPAERARASQLKGSALRNASPAEQRAAVSSQFEAVLVRQLLAPTVSSMLGKNGGAASSVYGDLLTDTFAQQLTAGSGLGLSRLLEKQLTPRAPVIPSAAPTQT